MLHLLPRERALIAGGAANSISLAGVNAWCDVHFGRYALEQDLRAGAYDVPWLVDNHDVERDFGWRAQSGLEMILEEIASHVQEHPDWLDRSGL